MSTAIAAQKSSVMTSATDVIRRLTGPDLIVGATALFVILNGLSVCIGWWVHVPIMVQLRPDDAVTHINTALCFILIGLGEIGMVLHRPRIVTAMAGSVMVFVGLEASQTVLNVTLGIDTLFAQPFIGADALHPGRMSANTMACFFLIGCAHVVMAAPQRVAARSTTIAVIMKTLAAGIALVALLGYIVHLQSAYGWFGDVGMSIRTWLGFLIIIMARIAALWKRDVADEPGMPQWFLPFLGTATASVLVGLVLVFTSSDARPFMSDPIYAVATGRVAIAVSVSMATVLILGTIGVLAARGKAVLALSAIADMNSRRRMEERFRQVGESAPNAMVMIDRSGRIELVNAEAERLFGYGRAELLGQKIEMLVPQRFRPGHPSARSLFFADPKVRRMGAGRDLFGVRKDGSEFPVEIGLNPIETDEGTLALAAIVDITARKRMEVRFQQVVELAPNAMVMINGQGEIELVNVEAERLFGYERAELLGQKVEMLVPARFRADHPGSRSLFFANPKVRRMGAGRDLFGVKKDGGEFPVEIGLNPIVTEQGTMALAAIVDISARKRMEARFQQVVESSPNAMVMINRQGEIELVNVETERLFGYERAELLGQKVEMLVPERFRSHHPASRSMFFADAKVRPMGAGRDLYGITKDGREFPIEIGLNPIDTDEGILALAAIVDITTRVITEQRLKGQAEDLRRSNSELEQFAYIASHDLKAPIRGIDNAAKWLESDLKGTLSEETQRILDLMRSRVTRMERLLDDLLAYSRAGRVDMAVQKIVVRDLIENVVQLLAIPEHIEVRIEGESPAIETATTQLEQIFRNLINNAVKHHDKPRGEIVISGRRLGDVMEFSVRDDGPGIAPEYHQTIFKLFQTLKRRDEVEGSGMGLAIVKKLVEQQRSSITVHSDGSGKGADFRFQWPIGPRTGAEKGVHNA